MTVWLLNLSILLLRLEKAHKNADNFGLSDRKLMATRLKLPISRSKSQLVDAVVANKGIWTDWKMWTFQAMKVTTMKMKIRQQNSQKKTFSIGQLADEAPSCVAAL